MFTELLKSALTLVAAFVVRWFFALIAVPIDDVLFNSIVAGIVVWLMTQLGYGLTVRVLPDAAVERGFLKEE